MNANVLIKKLMGVSTVTKSRTGFLIALVAIIGIVGKEILINIRVLSSHTSHVCIGIALAGFLSWIIGWVRETKQLEADQGRDTTAEGQPVEEHPLAFLVSLKYWGLIMVLSAGVITCLTKWSRRAPELVVRARPLSVTVTVTNVVTITNEAPPVVFPSLQLQGVVLNGAKSTALINGRVLTVGDDISNVVLVAVESEHALVALGGQTNVLAMRR
jgi:hypothetical protein